MGLPEEIAADVAELENEIPQTFRWKNQDYPCTAGALSRQRRMELGGLGNESDVVIFVRPTVFGEVTPPASQEQITFRRRTLTVVAVIAPAGSPFLRLECKDSKR